MVFLTSLRLLDMRIVAHHKHFVKNDELQYDNLCDVLFS